MLIMMFMKDNGFMTKQMDLDTILILMVLYIKEIGLMINKKVMV